MNVAIIIPALNPDEKLLMLVDELSDAGFSRIIMVDDGSAPECVHYFDEALRCHPECVLLRHPENLGKGRAIKTALAALPQYFSDCTGAVTADSDGQHRVEDILSCARALTQNPGCLILGARDFASKSIPPRSALGNRITRFVVKLIIGTNITDTQTGLRGIPSNIFQDLQDIPGDRYEFETNMLLEAGRLGAPFLEIPVGTVYIDGNTSSHFRPLMDSLRIYGHLAKFFRIPLICFASDFALFLLVYHMLGFLPAACRIFTATVSARFLSAVLGGVLKRFRYHSSREKNTPKSKWPLLPRRVLLTLASFAVVFPLTAMTGMGAASAKLTAEASLALLSLCIRRCLHRG